MKGPDFWLKIREVRIPGLLSALVAAADGSGDLVEAIQLLCAPLQRQQPLLCTLRSQL